MNKIDFDRCCKANQSSHIPVSRVINKLDSFFSVNDMSGAGEHLLYWRNEAKAAGDLSGELTVVNEQLGYYRKIGDRQSGLEAVSRSLELVGILKTEHEVSGATVILNAATTLKAFGKAEEAMELYNRAYAVYSENLPENDPKMGGFYNNKALALVDLGRYEEAEICYKAALGIMSQAKGGLADLAVTYVNMAHLYDTWFENSEEKSVECLNEAEAILNKPEIIRDSYYAYVCSKCAPSFDYFGFFIFAAELRERSEKIYAGS